MVSITYLSWHNVISLGFAINHNILWLCLIFKGLWFYHSKNQYIFVHVLLTTIYCLIILFYFFKRPFKHLCVFSVYNEISHRNDGFFIFSMPKTPINTNANWDFQKTIYKMVQKRNKKGKGILRQSSKNPFPYKLL